MKKKRFLSGLLAAAMAFSTAISPTAPFVGELMTKNAVADSPPFDPTGHVSSNKCGVLATWSRDDNGVLSIKGSGPMYDWALVNANGNYTSPWRYYHSVDKDWYFSALDIQLGITYIGNNSFVECMELTDANIPESVTSIGEGAFYQCFNLTNVSLPDSIIDIGSEAFLGCLAFTRIDIPENMKKLSNNYSFAYCRNVTTVTIPESIIEINPNTFEGCENLKDIYYSGTKEQWANIKNINDCTELNLATIHFADSDLPENCEPLYEKVTFNEHTYQLFKFTNTSGKNAIKYCDNLGGYMAHINDKEENTFLSNYLKEKNIDYAYFGYSDEDVEGEWVWVDGQNSSFTNWDNNEPNNEFGLENYALIKQSGLWNDGKFENDAANGGAIVICEWNNPKPVEQTLGTVHFLSDYNALDQTIRLDNELTYRRIEDPTNAEKLVGKYVLVKPSDDNSGVKPVVAGVEPVESKIGTALAVGDKSVSFESGVFIPVNTGSPIFYMEEGTDYLYHIYNGEIVDFSQIVKKIGVFKEWNKETQTVTIDELIYHTNIFTDMTFTDKVDSLVGKKVDFTISDSMLNFVLSIIESSEQNIEPDPNNRIQIDFRDVPMEIVWNDNLFNHSVYEYDNNIAIAACALSGAAESETDEEIVTLLKKLGFPQGNIKTNMYGTSNPYQPAYAFADKKITLNGKIKTLISLTIRGSTSAEDWLYTDFVDGAIYGFANSMQFIDEELIEYLKEINYDANKDDAIFLITGHSMGGAIAGNLVSELIDAEVASKDNIFAYTFASPNYANSFYHKNNNLFEVINIVDIVPKVGNGFHAGKWILFDPVFVKNFYIYWNLWYKGFLIDYDKLHNHLVPTYMSFLLSGADSIEMVNKGCNAYLISVHCPVDVELYDSEGNLIARITDNKIDESIADEKVFCKVEGDKKYIFVESDTLFHAKLIGTDSGIMDFSVQKLKNIDEIVTDDDFVKYETVILEKNKEFISEITEKNETPEVSLYVIDPETGQPIKTVAFDGTETDLTQSKPYTITFEPNGGNVTTTNLQTSEDGKLAELPTPSRDGYTFDGWYTAAEGGNQITIETVFVEDTTVYAHWTINAPDGDPSDDNSTPDESTPSESTPEDNTSDDASSSDNTSSENNSDESTSDDNTHDVDNTTSDNTSSDDSGIGNSNDTAIGVGNNSDQANDSENEPNTNPSTGIAISILPLLIAASAVAITSRKKQ